MKPKLMMALLAALSLAPRAGVAQGPSLADLPVIDTSSAEAPEQWIARGHELYAASRYRESIAAFERALQLRVDAGADGAWNVARAYAQLGNRKQALRWLTHARQMGFRNEHAIRNEPAFDKFHDDARFSQGSHSPNAGRAPMNSASGSSGLLRVERSFNRLAACRPLPANASSSLPCSSSPKRDTTPRA